MKRLSWKYLAGLIDGEGCIDVQVTKGVYVRPRLRIRMAITAKHVLEYAQNTYGGHVIEGKPSDNPTWSQAVSWECTGYKQACKTLRNIVNHLILKKEQARFCLWLERNVKGKQVSTQVRDAIRDELKLMKRDPHRLSEIAQDTILEMLQSDPS